MVTEEITTGIIDVFEEFLEASQVAQKTESLKPIIARVEKDMQRLFRKQKRLYLEGLAKQKLLFAESIGNPEHNRICDNVFFATQTEMEEILRETNSRSIKIGGDNTLFDLRMAISFNLENPRAVDYLSQHGAKMVTKINETTRDYLKTVVTEGVEKGWSYDRMANKITERFEQFAIGKPQAHIDSRAHLIAVTESAHAYETGGQIAANSIESMGILLQKKWHNVGDSRVSAGCRINSQADWIDNDKEFPSGHQHSPRFPGCRCTVLRRRKEKEGIIPKPRSPIPPKQESTTRFLPTIDSNFGIAQIMGSKVVNLIDDRLSGLTDKVQRINDIGEALINEIDAVLPKIGKMRDNHIHGKVDLILSKKSLLDANGQESVALGLYGSREQQILIGTRPPTNIVDPIKIGQWNTGESVKIVMRHEYGHHVHLTLFDRQQFNEWQDFYRSKSKAVWGKNVSRQGSMNEAEAFAESFTIYTSKEYGKTVTLPKDIERKLESLIGKRTDL